MHKYGHFMSLRVVCPNCKSTGVIAHNNEVSEDMDGLFLIDLYCHCHNPDCYASFVVQAGHGLQSATTTKATATGSQAAQLKIRLQKYLPAEGETIDPALAATRPNAAKVQNCITALDNYGQGANVLNAHVQQRLESFLDDMNVAAAVKEIDSVINDAPPSCTNIKTIAGTLAGATDRYLNAASSALDELDQGITDYDAGDMERPSFEALLDRIAGDLTSSIAGVTGLVSNEVQKVEEMYKIHKQMARSFSVQALIQDDCVRPYLVQLAGPQLSQVLVDDFNVSDLIEQA